MNISSLFYGLALGSLLVAVLKQEFLLPRRPYHAVLLALLVIGVIFQSLGM